MNYKCYPCPPTQREMWQYLPLVKFSLKWKISWKKLLFLGMGSEIVEMLLRQLWTSVTDKEDIFLKVGSFSQSTTPWFIPKWIFDSCRVLKPAPCSTTLTSSSCVGTCHPFYEAHRLQRKFMPATYINQLTSSSYIWTNN